MLWYMFELRTWFEEGESVFCKAAEALQSCATEIGNHAETLTIANELRGHAVFFAFRRGNTVTAFDILTLVRSDLPAKESVYIQLYLGIVCRDLGKFTEANEALHESLVNADTYGDQWLRSMAGQFLGIIALEMGDSALAHRYLIEALAIGREMGNPC